jgi:membrane-associated protease RseP (regulator of RpoE activity)
MPPPTAFTAGSSGGAAQQLLSPQQQQQQQPQPAPRRAIGIKLETVPLRTTRTRVTNPLQAAEAATRQTVRLTTRIATELTRALSSALQRALVGDGAAGKGGGGAPAPKLEGPVGILSSAIALAGSGEPQVFAAFIATISLNIAVFNTLPVPGLDGGQMAFLALDAIAETAGVPRLDRRIKETVGIVFALLLTALALSVLATDVGRAAGLVK